jgi:hypothetical protein
MSKIFTKVVEPNIAECPSCGGRLTLYQRPVNVEYLECAACKDEFTPDYLAGFLAGKIRAAQLHVQPTGVGAELPDRAIMGRCGHPRYRCDDMVEICPYCDDPAYVPSGPQRDA